MHKGTIYAPNIQILSTNYILGIKILINNLNTKHF
jgi:hypothetical protein